MTISGDVLAYHRAQIPGDVAICDLLAREIDAALDGAENKIWHRHPVWFLAGNPIVGYSRLKGGMRLMFWSGQSFDEPGLAPEGTFKAAEARYASVDDVDVVVSTEHLASLPETDPRAHILRDEQGAHQLRDVQLTRG